MLKLLSFLFRKSRRELASVALELLGKGYSAQDLKSLLTTAGEHGWKGSDLRAMREENRKLRSELDRRQPEKSQEDFQPGQRARKVLEEAYGHANSVIARQCLDAEGNPVPWYTYPAIDFLRQIDFSSARVFAFGSGASIPFWSARAREVISVEHDADDHARTIATLPANVRVHLVEHKREYLQRIELESGTFDVIIVDGAHHLECVEPASKMLSPTGFLILNHADWFPGTAQELRSHGLLQVDMQGLGPIHEHTWTTSFFFQPGTRLLSAHARQPYPSPASLLRLSDISVDPVIEKPSLNGLDEKLAPYLNFRNGLFIEAGANNGFTQSNTYYLENSLGWKGMLVEAVPHLAQQARNSRARSTVYPYALVADEKATPSVTIHWCDLMSIVEDQHPSPQDREHHLKSGAEVQGLTGSHQLQVPARTLSSLIDAYQPEHEIDFFSLDVEGYETEVLKGLDFSRHQPRRILVETRRLPEIAAMLTPHGYVMEAALSEHDYLFLHESIRNGPQHRD